MDARADSGHVLREDIDFCRRDSLPLTVDPVNPRCGGGVTGKREYTTVTEVALDIAEKVVPNHHLLTTDRDISRVSWGSLLATRDVYFRTLCLLHIILLLVPSPDFTSTRASVYLP